MWIILPRGFDKEEILISCSVERNSVQNINTDFILNTLVLRSCCFTDPDLVMISWPPPIPNLSIPSASLLPNHLWPGQGGDLWPHRVTIKAEAQSSKSNKQAEMMLCIEFWPRQGELCSGSHHTQHLGKKRAAYQRLWTRLAQVVGGRFSSSTGV